MFDLVQKLDEWTSDPLRRFQFSLLVILLVATAGVAGYVVLERMSPLQAIYMTVITLTTVGFREVKTLSQAGTIFTIGLILTGVIAVAWAARNAAEVLLGESLWETVRRQRMETRIKSLEDHYILCGYGRIGQQIVRDLEARGERFVVIDQQEAKAEALREEGHLFIVGDATEEDTLMEAGVERAKGLVATLNSDADNVLSVLTARGLSERLLIAARASNETSISKLRRAGADRVVSPYIIGGHRLALSLLRPSVDDFLSQLFHFGEDLDVDIGQITVEEKSPLAGQTIAGSDLRKEWGLSVLAVISPQGELDMTPSSDHHLQPGETLIVIGARDAIYRLEEAHLSGL
ncbi:MAG: NAD-binding protein [Anaerolineales bacterium]|nr:NAD-binding protein [Anaerolineales bacterium]